MKMKDEQEHLKELKRFQREIIKKIKQEEQVSKKREIEEKELKIAQLLKEKAALLNIVNYDLENNISKRKTLKDITNN